MLTGCLLFIVWVRKKDVENRLCVDYSKCDKTGQNVVLVRKKDVDNRLCVDY